MAVDVWAAVVGAGEVRAGAAGAGLDAAGGEVRAALDAVVSEADRPGADDIGLVAAAEFVDAGADADDVGEADP